MTMKKKRTTTSDRSAVEVKVRGTTVLLLLTDAQGRQVAQGHTHDEAERLADDLLTAANVAARMPGRAPSDRSTMPEPEPRTGTRTTVSIAPGTIKVTLADRWTGGRRTIDPEQARRVAELLRVGAAVARGRRP